VIESGLVTEAGDHYTAAGPVVPLAIPSTLHASLLARLDRLAPTREVAQIGAALGRQFTHELISAVAAMPGQQLDNALAQLVNAELIFRRGTAPDAEYSFNSQVTNGCPFQLPAPRSSSEGVAVAEPCERSQARASLSEKMRSAWTLLAIRLQPLLGLRGDVISSAPPSILA
jgi:hypothetical protein